MNVKLPMVNINANSTMTDVKRYLVALVDAIETALEERESFSDSEEYSSSGGNSSVRSADAALEERESFSDSEEFSSSGGNSSVRSADAALASAKEDDDA